MEIQRKIVESKLPPSNKEVWWFDLNDEVIKIYKSGKWIATADPANDNEYNSPYGIVKYLTDDNTVLPEVSSALLVNQTEVIFDNNSVPDSAFRDAGNAGIRTILLQDVKTIGKGAFNKLTDLNFLYLGNVQYIKSNAFRSCKYLDSIHLPDSIIDIEPGSLPAGLGHGLSCITGKHTIDDTFVVIDSKLIYTAAGYPDFEDHSLRIPNSVKILRSESVAFLKYYSESTPDDGEVTVGWDVYIPESVQEIEEGAFGLSSMSICNFYGKFARENGAFCIYNNNLIAFAGSENTSANIPEDVIRIDKRAFQRSLCLETVHIPSSVKSIGQYAFLSIDTLKSIYINSTVPPVLDLSVFGEATYPLNAIIYVPEEAVETYKSATNWSAYADKIKGYKF